MINLHNENVLNLSETQMNALIGLKFSETPSHDPSVIQFLFLILQKYLILILILILSLSLFIFFK